MDKKYKLKLPTECKIDGRSGKITKKYHCTKNGQYTIVVCIETEHNINDAKFVEYCTKIGTITPLVALKVIQLSDNKYRVHTRAAMQEDYRPFRDKSDDRVKKLMVRI